MTKKLICLVITVFMLAGLSTVAMAAPEDGLCPHHTAHDAACGYAAAKAEVPCGHVCSAELGCTAATAEVPCGHVCSAELGCTAATAEVPCTDVHVHDALCGYAEAVLPACAHAVHDGSCGYSAGTPGTPCNHTCDIDEGCQNMGYCTHVHDEYCNYSEGTPGTPCGHVCAAELGCTLGAAAQPCTYVHTHNELCGYAPAKEAVCAHTAHDSTCGYAPAQAATCAHTAHDASCGYAPAAAEIPCAYAAGCDACNPFLKASISVASGGVYDGTAKTPAVTVTIDGTALVENTDYTLVYENNINAGNGTANVYITGIGAYAGQSAAASFSISRAPLIITANSFSKVYGEADPTFTYEVEGIVAGENVASILEGSPARTEGENVGSYDIRGGTLKVISGNYGIKSYTYGYLTISPRPITVTAQDQSIVYSAAPDTTKVTAEDLLTGHSITDATLTPASTDVTTTPVDLTPSKAVITDGTNDVSANYSVTYKPGKLTITPKTVTPTITLTPNKYTYTGQPIVPSKIEVKDGSTLIPSTEYTVSYANNVGNNIATTTATVSVTDVAGGNYIIVTASAPFSIITQAQALAERPVMVTNMVQTFVPGSYTGLSFTVKAPAANLLSSDKGGVMIDGRYVDNGYYTVTPNNTAGVEYTIVTLNPNLLNSELLGNGTHTVTFNFSNGTVNGSFIKGSSTIYGVKTGDNNAPGLLALVMCLGLMSSAALIPVIKKQSKG